VRWPARAPLRPRSPAPDARAIRPSRLRDTRGMSTDNTTLIRDGFEAFLRGDFDALRSLLAPDAQWLYWEPIPGDCDDPGKIIATLRKRRDEGVVGGVEKIVDGGEKLLVEISGPRLEEWGLPEGRAAMVVTMRDGRIVRLQDHRTRDALFDAGGRSGCTPAAGARGAHRAGLGSGQRPRAVRPRRRRHGVDRVLRATGLSRDCHPPDDHARAGLGVARGRAGAADARARRRARDRWF
jgi:ketosteroid isomerase-like protein